MIKKILLLSDNRTNWEGNRGSIFKFLKTGSSLRLSYDLRKEGYEVKQIHSCLSFTMEEINTIFDNFSSGDEVVVGISTSFINSNSENFYSWGDETYNFLMNVLPLLKTKKSKIIMGGFLVKSKNFKMQGYREKFCLEDRKSTRLNSSHIPLSRMPSSA